MVYFFSKDNFILTKVVYLFALVILVSSCSLKETIVPTKSLNDKKKIYSIKEYKQRFYQDLMTDKSNTMHIKLSLEDLELLNKPYAKATKEEINNDVAYNKHSMRLDQKYINMINFLATEENIIKLAKHLKYKKNNIKYIVYNENKAIVLFVGSSYSEKFLIALDSNVLRIKLIGYLYGS